MDQKNKDLGLCGPGGLGGEGLDSECGEPLAEAVLILAVRVGSPGSAQGPKRHGCESAVAEVGFS
jgi:hypothetical protein